MRPLLWLLVFASLSCRPARKPIAPVVPAPLPAMPVMP